MYELLAIVPIVLAIGLMVFAKQKASVAMFSAWALAAVLGVFFWQMNVSHAGAWTFFGFLQALPVLFIVFAAVFMLNVLLELKFIKTIGNGFDKITKDRRIQILIISWFFAAFIEGAAGFGTPHAIAGPLLVGLGVPPFLAAISVLISNAVPTLFGAAGTPTTAGYATIEAQVQSFYEMGYIGYNSDIIFQQFNNGLAFTHMFFGSLLPFIIVYAVVSRDGRKRGLKDAWPMLGLSLLAGVLYTVPAWLISFLGPQLPTLGGAIIGLPLFLLCLKFGFLVPKEIYRFQDDEISSQQTVEKEKTGLSQIAAWSPYAIIILILVITRLPWLGIARFLNPANAHIAIDSLFGLEGINWHFNPLWNPGIFPFIPVVLVLLAIFLVKGKTNVKVVTEITGKTLGQLKHATIALLFGVALVQIMLNTNFTQPYGDLGSMTNVISLAISRIFGDVYLFVSPFIGILGSFVSGSHTVSNIMFYGMQIETAITLELPITAVLVAQTSGGALGNMIAIYNIIAAAATTGYKGKESKLMAATFLPMLIYSVVVSILLILFINIGLGWIR